MTWSTGLSVTANGTGVAHAGSVDTRQLADRAGLTGALVDRVGQAVVPTGPRPGRVLVDLAVLLADGGEAVADIDALRHQSQVLGPVASPPTGRRTLYGLTPAASRRVEKACGTVRRHVWAQLRQPGWTTAL